MTSFEQAVSIVKRAMSGKEDKIPWQIGYLGDGAGNVYTARENYYLVRYPYENSPAVPVYCKANIAIVDGLRIIVGYLPWEPGRFQVISQSDQRIDVNGSDTGGSTETPQAPGTGVGYTPNSAPHSVNHQYLSIDPVYLNWRQITPLGVFPTNPATLSVQVHAGYIPRPGADIFVNDQLVDLTASVPVSGARYSLISYDSTGTVVVTDGTVNTGGFSALTAADIPDTPAGNWRSAAIVLYAGQTSIVETRSEIDFFDLRFPEERTAGSVSPSDIPLANTHILVGNGSGVAADVAMSNDATLANTGAITLKNTGPGATGPIGGTTAIPIVTIDAQGRVTALSSAAIYESVSAYNEVQIADGLSTTYHLMNYANPGTIRVYKDGIRLPATDDTSTTDEVIFDSAPALGAVLMFDYELETA